MGKPIDWKRLTKKAVAEAALSVPNELAYFYMGEYSFGQLLMKIRASLANEEFPEPTKQDLKNLFIISPIPKPIQQMLKAEAPDYEHASYHLSLEALLGETVNRLLEYLDEWAGAEIDRIEAEYTKEFNERDLENQKSMSAGEKALLQQELDEAVERRDLYQIYWLKRYLDSGLPAAQIELDRRAAGKIMAVIKPAIEQFAGAAPPSMSGARLSGPIPVVDRNYRPLEVGQHVRVRWSYYHVNIRDDEGIVTKVDQYGGITIKTDHPVPHFDRNGFIVHEEPWIYYSAEYDYDRKVRRAAGYVGDGSLLGSMETFVEIVGPKEWSPKGQVKWSTP